MAGIAVPIVPSKVDAWQAWLAEIRGPKAAEFADFNRRMGLTEHRVWLVQSPQGPMAVVVHGGPGGDAFMARLADASEPFDVWFRDNVKDLHALDFEQALSGPPPQAVLDWRA